MDISNIKNDTFEGVSDDRRENLYPDSSHVPQQISSP